jgi:endonuclease YncB( thermonuclease family)
MINITTIICLIFVASLMVMFWTPRKPPIAPQSVIGRVSYVVDGDTLQIGSHRPRVRLWGVNSPERHERGFHEATAYLKHLTRGQRITCQVIARDKYGRTVGRCYLANGQDLGALMIAAGHAREMHGFSRGYYSRIR